MTVGAAKAPPDVHHDGDDGGAIAVFPYLISCVIYFEVPQESRVVVKESYIVE